ncbi:uncharacterized protein LOC18785819 [Prunus persica]|uniref:uncharacterized protein LOC18785819 n=1 Tax=Prunus persica TaxID=3760 RepID=UPI0009AB65AF|nr:uncharacterized protein LOC18785819 [Prunus persica]
MQQLLDQSTCRLCVLVIASVFLLGFSALFLYIPYGLVCITGTSITKSHRSPESPDKRVPSACGNINNIISPFRIANDTNQSNCTNWDYYYYNLYCDNNLTVLTINRGRYYVQAINYDNFTIRVVDPGIRNNDFSSIPRYSLSIYNLTSHLRLASSTTPITFFKCAKAVNSSAMSTYNYVKQGTITASDMEDGCRIEWTTLMSKSFLYETDRNFSYHDIHNALGYGFELQFRFLKTSYKLDIDLLLTFGIKLLLSYGAFFPIRSIFGFPFLAALLIYKQRRRHLSMYSNIEDFLQSDNNLSPIRYSYLDIKKMTSRFNEKLGEGGYDCI